jgi:hypothetical protein
MTAVALTCSGTARDLQQADPGWGWGARTLLIAETTRAGSGVYLFRQPWVQPL